MKTKIITLSLCTIALFFAGCTSHPQGEEQTMNDSNTPLHALASDYKVPYGVSSEDEIVGVIDRIYNYLEQNTPFAIVDLKNDNKVIDIANIDSNSTLQSGVFRLTSYEWGVTYAGMLNTGEKTGNSKYTDYVIDRYNALTALADYSRDKGGKPISCVRSMVEPHALDDAGAICAAMIKTAITSNKQETMREQIDVFIDYIMNKEHRLSDGTFARNRPQTNTLWLDDMFMSVPAIAQMGRLTGDTKYFDEATKQIRQFTQRMFVADKGLYMHGWVESSPIHPKFHWGRANGWAILTMTEVLDVLPKNHPDYEFVLDQYCKHIAGITSYQSGDGFWHQLLDRNDSYLETSATAIFTYCIARGINNGWLDAVAFGPIAQLGWNAITTMVNEQGQVEGTCVGTGMAFDPAFYYYRLTSPMAAHGYGPVLLAGSEMIALNRTFAAKSNDSAVHYYNKIEKTGENGSIFSVEQ